MSPNSGFINAQNPIATHGRGAAQGSGGEALMNPHEKKGSTKCGHRRMLRSGVTFHSIKHTRPVRFSAQTVTISTFLKTTSLSYTSCRVAPAGFPAEALPRSGLGDFHHPALPPKAAHGVCCQSEIRILTLGSGKSRRRSLKRSHVSRERWLRRFSHLCQIRPTLRRNCHRARLFPLTAK